MSKTKAQTDQNTPHMKNIPKHEKHTAKKLLQISSSNINHKSIKIQPEFSQGAVDTDRAYTCIDSFILTQPKS